MAIECGLILYVNFTNRLHVVNQDAANAYVHAAEMWKNHSFYIPQWKYETTAEWDCAVFFAMPLYGLTHNIHVAFALSNTIFLFIFIWTAFKVYEGYDSFYPLLSLCFILIPYSVGMLSYFNMLFFMASQYIVKVLVPLMLAAVLLHFDYHKKTDILFLAILCLFTFLTACSSGIYVWGCGIMGVLAGFVFLSCDKKEKLKKHFYMISALMLLCTAAGYMIDRFLQTGTKGNDLKLRTLGGG